MAEIQVGLESPVIQVGLESPVIEVSITGGGISNGAEYDDSALWTAVNVNAVDIEDLQSDIEELQDAIDQIPQFDPTALQTSITNNSTNISSLQASVTANATSIAELQEAVSNNAGIDELRAEIEQLHPLTISSFSIVPNLVEKGTTVSSITATFASNRTGVTFKIGDTEVTSPATITDSITANKTFTLTATKGSTSVTKNASITFTLPLLYGVGTSYSATQDVLAPLTKQLKTSKSTSFSVNATSGKYILFALPTSYGTPSFTVGGFSGGFVKSGECAFNNAGSNSTTYALWRSTNASLGQTTVNVS